MVQKRNPLVIIGPGRWGRALALVFQTTTDNATFLDRASTSREWTHALLNRSSSPLVVISTPFAAVSTSLQKLKKFSNLQGVINASKGIDRRSLLTFSQLAKSFLKVPYASLSGPTFAQEVMELRPTACVLASKNNRFIQEVAKNFSSSTFRIYTSSDPVGVEVCGAIKNILAIACGISDGLELGDNARAALLTRGLKEMNVFVKFLGGKSTTVYGLAGVGDLWLTATGNQSRNRQLGLLLAKSPTLEHAQKQVEGPVEGLYTLQQIYKLSRLKKIDAPIAEALYKICYQRESPKTAIERLMSRALKSED